MKKNRMLKAQKKITLDNNGDIVITLDFNDARWIANRLEELSRTGCSANMSKKLTSMARRLRKECDSLEICCNCKTWKRERKMCVGTCPHADGVTAEWMWGCPDFSKKTCKRS